MLNSLFKVNELQWDKTTHIIRVWSTKATQMYNLWWTYCTRQKKTPQIFPSLVLARVDKHICQTPMYLHLFFFRQANILGTNVGGTGPLLIQHSRQSCQGLIWSLRTWPGLLEHDQPCNANEIKKMKLMQKAPNPSPKVFPRVYRGIRSPLKVFWTVLHIGDILLLFRVEFAQ